MLTLLAGALPELSTMKRRASLRERQDAWPSDLFAALRGDRVGRIDGQCPLANAGVEHPQEVVDLGDRADGAPRIPTAGLLLDRDRGGEAVDPVDVGLGQLSEELTGVAGKALNITALAFGVEGVEGQRALARAGDAGEADQGPLGEVERDVAEVVLARAANPDFRFRHPCDVLVQFGTTGLERPGPVY